MIKRKTQIITQIFHSKHRGIDLRCVNFITRKNQDVIAPEQMIILRQGRDSFGNYFLVCRPLESNYSELKFIHINKTNFTIGQVVEKGEKIGNCIIGGNSNSLHLHFETWRDGRAMNPIYYFDKMGIKYKMKGKQ